ncbi:MAG: 4-alpha-glucanotransferase, partial [Lentisphaeria bacterium]|nr:4-alpha-glucanotransferase [Lentisphaeria bacterium]
MKNVALFEFFKKRFEFNFELFDGIRIDHFRAFSEYYTIPFGAKDAIGGKWVKAPGEKIVDLIKKQAKDKLIIAENLGSIDDKVMELLDYSGFKSMSVFQFGFDGNPDNPHLPHNYNNNTVAFTGTHDNITLLGFMWEAESDLRQTVLDYIGFTNPNFDGSYDKIIECMLRSSAGLVLLPI